MLSHKPIGAVETTEAAPAKINLALHVTGQRADGYHLLEMLVTFTEVGDVVHIEDALEDRFSISGPFSHTLMQSDAGDNLVLKARDFLRQASGLEFRPVAIHLEKNLPVSSGIGGGSADAAATLRGLCRHWNIALAPGKLAEIALKLGADVPMCLASQPLMARGIGEDIEMLHDMPVLNLVLVNPLKGVSTPEIFKRLTSKNNPTLGERGDEPWMAFIGKSRNDLEPPARAVLTEIGEASDLLSQAGAELLRMSGSGATCFGIFSTVQDAETAADTLRQQRPGWYVQSTKTIDGLPR
ncbi:4-(cytidine 5'-diphospho)-2-C-methyl-D-erythritol kinase [Agrobacterium rosae]|uniref:4-(cytidine 5'-diphospho)-2-C-methyl-D-erythritol kinase n=1 Tax=Agrobacterium rosae TaxID=1972867 RepID=UPI000CD82EA0|nr:4-(cytidine 5'-diphospho)-2-C-methyl-D-erythritol kinase [Agrobacterium rosae]POO56514.1 4-(cytidine 5'-diphospho)-2-C-methyl-D-erythritol kinase [Agrobacterium rosae]